jgi:phage host-nuclease inhibitor protein Gam
MIDFAINKDSELYATLKLPRLQEYVEADQAGIGEHGLKKRKQAEFKEGLVLSKQMPKDKQVNEVVDLEILLNKDAFQEIGLL